MKVKTSITISKDLLQKINERARLIGKNRSVFIETAVHAYIKQQERDEINARDLAIINARANALNETAADVLAYQAPFGHMERNTESPTRDLEA